MAKRNTKSALLLSVVSIVICCTMLLGTTMAWFTDSVTSTSNIIKTGTLDVEMSYRATADDEWADASEGAIFDYQLWEPGYSDLKYVKIENKGDLAFKYQLNIIPVSTPAEGEVNLADVIDVYYGIVDETTTYDSFEAAQTALTKVGTLSDLMTDADGAAYGILLPAEGKGSTDVELPEGYTEVKGEVTVCIVLHMQESAGNEYQNRSVGNGFSVQLFATQFTYENDSFDNLYDEDAELPVVANAASQDELNAAISSGANTIYLTAGTYTLPSTSDSEITIIGGNDTVIDITKSVNMSGSDITFSGVTVKSDNGGFANGIQHVNTVTYNNATIVGSRSLYGAKEVFNNCTFDLTGISDYLWTYGAKEVEFNNCLFNTQGKAILVYNEGTVGSSVVTINDCIFAATETAHTGAGDPCAAVEIDGSLIPGTYTVNFNGTNTVSNKFAGISRIKAQKDPANVTVNENGRVVTAETVVVEAPADLDAAIAGGADTVILGSGNYIIPDSAKGKTLTIIGNGETVVAAQDDGAAEGDGDYSFDGSNVTFENVTITTSTTYFPGYVRMNGTYNNCTINGVYTLYGDSIFNDCTFNVSGDIYNIWTWGATNATFNGCTFNSDGKALLLYGTVNTNLTVNNCVFNDNGGLTDLKAAIEIGDDYGKSYTLTVNDTVVNGYEINDKGINTGSTLWANKNSMGTDKLNVVIDGVDVY